jgi:hypothetical protein
MSMIVKSEMDPRVFPCAGHSTLGRYSAASGGGRRVLNYEVCFQNYDRKDGR